MVHAAAPLIDAARAGDGTEVTKIIRQFIDGADGSGWTALHQAIARGHHTVVASLIAAKADVRMATEHSCVCARASCTTAHLPCTYSLASHRRLRVG